MNTYAVNIVENIEELPLAKIKIQTEKNNIDLIFFKTKDNKYFAKYDFMTPPNGKHIEFFARYVKDKFFEINEKDWENIKNDTIGAE